MLSNAGHKIAVLLRLLQAAQTKANMAMRDEKTTRKAGLSLIFTDFRVHDTFMKCFGICHVEA